MTTNLFLCSKLASHENKTLLKVDVNDLSSTTADQLNEIVAQKLDTNANQFELTCYGHCLNGDKTLDSFGIKNGSTIFVLQRRPEKQLPLPVAKEDINKSIIAAKTAMMSPHFRSFLAKLHEPEFRANLCAVTPGLCENEITFAILQDAELFATFIDSENIHKVMEKYPCLTEAINSFVAAFHENELQNDRAGSSSRPPVVPNYSLDAMSDDDEDMSASSTPSGSAPLQPTARQLAEMITQAFQSGNPIPSTSSGSVSPRITREMLQQAIQQSQSQSQAQAQAQVHSQAHIQSNPQAHSRETTPSAVTSPRPAIAATSTSSQTSLQTLATRYNTQLQQLREIGFFDQESSLRALEATNGDVQLAVNLLFHDS